MNQAERQNPSTVDSSLGSEALSTGTTGKRFLLPTTAWWDRDRELTQVDLRWQMISGMSWI